MSVNSQNNESLDHSPTKVKSKSPFSSNVLQYKKSLTSIQMSQTTKEASDSANSDDTKHVIYPNPERTYKPKQNPPDLALSLKHQKAHRVAPLESLLTSTDTCESTGVPFTDRKLPLCSKMNQIYHLGPVFPMYFLLIKQIAVIMIFLCLLAGALALLQLQSTVKPSSYIDYIDILYQSGLQTTTMVMGSLCIILVLLFILYKFRQQHKRTKRKCKGGNLSCSDYTVMSSNLADTLSEQELKSFFSHFIVPNYSLDVVKVTKTYDIETYIWKIRHLSRLVRERQDIVAHLKGEPSGSDLMRFEDLEKEIEAINDYFSKRETELTNFQLLEKNDVCFVTFNTRQEAKVVKRRFELTPVQRFFLKLTQFFSRDLNEYYLDKKFVKIQKAPEPGDIIWENLSKRKPSFWFVLAYLFFCAIIYCITSFGLWQVSNLDSSYNGWFIGLIVAITNELFYCVVSGLALWERFLTITDKRIDLAYRLILLQMINMILPIYILDLLETEFIIDRLPSYILCIAVVSFAVPLLIRLIHPRHLMKVIRRTKAQLQGHKSPLDQEQANQVFEDSEINISALYSNLIKTLLFSCFGFGTSPGIAYVGLIALIFMHWIDKYNLFRRSLIPSYMRSEIAEAMNECLDISLFLIALGSLVWSLMMFRSDAVDEHLTIMVGGSIFQVIIALIYMLLPNKRISREWTRIERRQNNWSSNLFYQQAAEYFPGNYDLCWSLAERKMQPQEIKEKYNKTMKNFGSIGILNECPEVLPMFEYGDTHPSFFRSWTQGLEGLRDPFYIYPQNYGYGFIPLLAQNNSQKSGNKLPLLHEPGAQGLKKKENLTIFSGFTANADNRLNSNISSVHRTMHKQDTRDLFNVATEMVSAISGRQKASSGSSQGGDLNTTENESGRNKLKSETGNTMIFDSFRNEVLGERKETMESERSIMGLSPITENILLKSGEKTDKVGKK